MISFILLLLQLNLYNFSNSSTIFEKTVQYIKEGKMKVPNDMNYFIFDESNITALDINGDKMNNLYIKQKEIFDKYGVPNYIFAFDSHDESTEFFSVAADKLADYLSKKYNINQYKTIILLVSFSPSKMRIRTGELIKFKIMNYDCDKMIDKIRPFLQNKKYYDAWNQFISDTNGYLNSNTKSDNYEKRGKIIGTIVIIVLILLTATYFFFCCCFKKCRRAYRRNKIQTFLDTKFNPEIYKKYCVICLKQLNNEQIQITTQTDFNNTQQQNKTNENDINTLKCGHQYHNNCLSDNKIKDYCPICRKQMNSSLKDNNIEIIWAIQKDLYPYLNPDYDTIIDDGENRYDGPNYGGDGGSVGGNSYGGDSVGGGGVGGCYGSGGAEGNF